MTNQKELIVQVLTQLIPQTNLIAQNGNQWKLARPIPGMESFTNRGFGSREEAIDALAAYYVGNVSGLRTAGEGQGNVDTQKRAV